jgi:chromosome segregation ATPase
MDNPNDQEKKGFIQDTMRKFSLHIPGSESSIASQIIQYEVEIGRLQDQIKTLEDESEDLLRNLEKTINQYEVLKRKYYQTSEQMNSGRKQNEKLAAALQEAKNQIVALKEEIDKLCAPPNSYGTFRRSNKELANRIYRCCIRLAWNAEDLDKSAQSIAIRLQAIKALTRLLDLRYKRANRCVSPQVHILRIVPTRNAHRAPPLAA